MEGNDKLWELVEKNPTKDKVYPLMVAIPGAKKDQVNTWILAIYRTRKLATAAAKRLDKSGWKKANHAWFYMDDFTVIDS